MKEITILSGKGGTGKTTIAAAFASITEKTVFCDNDVDAANLHLILHPSVEEKYSFPGGLELRFDYGKCLSCGICVSKCRFNALTFTQENQVVVDSLSCEGCRLCERVCPVSAISSRVTENNQWFVSATRFGKLVHAKLAPGEENSGRLVTRIRKAAKLIARDTHAKFILNDGPPGIGCSVIASMAGTSMVIIVIEASMTGFNDAMRLHRLLTKSRINTAAIINKHDLGNGISRLIEETLCKEKIPVLARIPYSQELTNATNAGKSIFEYNSRSATAGLIRNAWQKIHLSFDYETYHSY